MQFARVNGLSIHYRLIGAPQKQPVIAFANSLGTDFRIWDGMVERLGGHFACLRYDKRGHGLSDLGEPPYAMADHVGDLVGLLDDDELVGRHQAEAAALVEHVGGLGGLAVEPGDVHLAEGLGEPLPQGRGVLGSEEGLLAVQHDDAVRRVREDDPGGALGHGGRVPGRGGRLYSSA